MPRSEKSRGSADWILGIAFTAIFCSFAYWLASDYFYRLEAFAYDRGIVLTQAEPDPRVAIIAIDERSIENIGRWPWSRDILAALINRLPDAKVIASTILMSEPQLDPGLEQLNQLQTMINDLEQQKALGETNEGLDAALATLRAKLNQSIDAINYDQQLAASIRAAGNVVLPMQAQLGASLGNPDLPLPSYVDKSRINYINPDEGVVGLPANRLITPIPELGEAAIGLGHLNLNLDVDGSLRSEPLIIDYFGQLFPSLALDVAARSINVGMSTVQIHPGSGINLGGLEIKTLPDLSMLNYFYPTRGSSPPFSTDSFYDVWTGIVPADKFSNKIVLIGPTAAGVGDFQATPIDSSTAPIEILAHTVSSILQQNFVVRPGWAWIGELSAILLIALYLGMVLPRMRAGTAALVSLLLVLIMLAVEYSMLVLDSEWIRMAVPSLLLLSGHLVMTVRGFRVTEHLRLRADEEGAESNKMLGLAFQNQGQLDMAFEKFRRCPLDQSMMDLLYNLGLDFERKRQFNKAGAVFGHMAEFDIEFRDIRDRLQRSQKMEQTMILGGSSATARTPMLLEEGSGVQKPVLGRYQIEKELGKGAMGVVYLGRDPKINRVVAIKTIPLAEEFEEEDIVSAKERFFREAETAGRLNHPDIVTVYDAGEDHDLAYIAMEYLKGDHLNHYVEPDNLLPPDEVLRIVARAADALNYAHKQNVVHRDIKPANMMYQRENDELKITDFGIARLTDSHTTKTGIVLGTPSYMSPEQLEGKTVTGHSDLFSLGVTLYQLLSGQLPFQSESMTGLMFKIANADHLPIKSFQPELPECVESVIDNALKKDPEKRFEDGAEMARALRACIEHLRVSA